MKTYYHSHNVRNDGTKDSFLTLELKNKQQNGNIFVLFNSRWHKVKEFKTFVNNDLIRKTFYIGPFSTHLQNQIQFQTERNFQKNHK